MPVLWGHVAGHVAGAGAMLASLARRIAERAAPRLPAPRLPARGAASALLHCGGSGWLLPRAGCAAARQCSALAAQPLGVPEWMRVSHEMGPLALNKIRDNYGARKKRKRVGRGVGSGRGRHAGRGMKGKKSRAGNHGLLRKGSGVALWKVVPKRGFRRSKRLMLRNYVYLNLDQLEHAVRSGRLDLPADRPLTVKELFDARLITLRGGHDGVKLLGRGSATFGLPVRIEVQDATAGAIAAIEAAGGHIETVYYSRLVLRALLKPHKFGPDAKRPRLAPRPALPRPRLMRHYLSDEKRGYLRNLKPGDVVRPHEQPMHVDADAPEGGWPAAPQIGYQRGYARKGEAKRRKRAASRGGGEGCAATP